MERRKQLGRNGKPLRAKPRAKGNRAEREVIDILHLHGWTSARRNFQSGGQGGGDITEGPNDLHVECKHQETLRLWEWIQQAQNEARPTDIPAVVFRRNLSGWYACIPLHDLIGLLKIRDQQDQEEAA